MYPIYNHTYQIKWKSGVKFNYVRTYPHLSYEGYKEPIYRQLPFVIDTLKENRTSRQAVIVVSHPHEEPNACLLSIQYGIDVVDNILYCTASFRSQCEIFGRPNDEKLILSITDDVQRLLGRNFNDIIITCNVFNYHRREDLVELYKEKPASR